MSIISIICCIIVFIILLIVGITMYKKSSTENNMMQTTAIVTNVSNCSSYTQNSRRSSTITTTCNLSIKYTVNNVDYSANIITNDTYHNVNEQITITYDKNQPQTPIYNYVSPKFVGKILIGISVIFFIGFIIMIVLHSKSDWYKRLMCISGVNNILRD